VAYTNVRLAERTLIVSGSFRTTLKIVPVVRYMSSPKKLFSSHYTLFLSQYENIFQLFSSTITRNMSHSKSSRIETYRYRPIWLIGQSQYYVYIRSQFHELSVSYTQFKLYSRTYRRADNLGRCPSLSANESESMPRTVSSAERNKRERERERETSKRDLGEAHSLLKQRTFYLNVRFVTEAK
jgi:hypothetical protein